MEDNVFIEYDIDWNDLFTELSDPSPAETFSNPSSDVLVSSWAAEIESLLMKDNDDDDQLELLNQQSLDNFFSDILVDSPAAASAEVIDVAAATDKDSNVSDESVPVTPEEEEKRVHEIEANDNNYSSENNDTSNNDKDGDADGADDPISKKRRRQLRNRDAAVRSRERKKTYVKDLEMKSRYLEGECRKLGRLLQCVLAENQVLRLSLQKGSAFGASSAKQESAVLLLESLLLGSLLWFLGIISLFIPTLIQTNLELVPLENVEEKALGNLAPRGAESKFLIFSMLKSRRCKASRTKMKMRDDILRVLA
ncbi:bZIP transcription factor 60-like [Mangifera indica]|uniref:bZIP transcription factor 60-like n=1 Tax=Mangifera indica TaxID=29780 RepID=UPI001CFA16DE|nr:bZIP transcription factor 60-like [Mangifera indica]